MAIRVLGDYLEIFRDLGRREALLHDTGYRQRRLSYRQLLGQTLAVAAFLRDRGCRPRDRLVLWSENRPEWLVVFWACVFSGIQVVPLDYRSSRTFVERVCRQVEPALLFAGERVEPAIKSPCPLLEIRQVESFPARDDFEPWAAGEDDPVQILFTSGTTSAPHGVLHTHRNLCAGLDPMQREIAKYRPYARPFQPIRMLCLLPLSHVFGQSFAVFIPPLLGGAAVLVDRINPRAVIETVRQEKVSVVAVVPRMLTGLEQEIRREFGLEQPRPLGSGYWGALRRWIRYWPVHRLLGLKFWSFVVGGAPLPRSQEGFWTSLGFVVVQGYGLTESTALVSLNHPFDSVRGSLGKVLPGFQVRVAPDGEILIRGPAVAASWKAEEPAGAAVTASGWLATGDLGRLDAEGRLYFLGRKKEVIVTAEGLNVYPVDVEGMLNRVEGVRQSLVVPRPGKDGEEVHAVLILEPGSDPREVVGAANQQLEPHQRVQGWSLWPEADFPRTAATLKVRRSAVAGWVAGVGQEPEAVQEDRDGMEGLVREISRPEVDWEPDNELGLSSLERIELLSRLEEQLGVNLNEEAFARSRTRGEIQRLVDDARRGDGQIEAAASSSYPGWTYRAVFRGFRSLFRELLLLRLLPRLLRVHSAGLSNLAGLAPPVIFAANHSSHLDTLVILAALPRKWRGRLAPAMSKEYFADYFEPAGKSWRRRLGAALQYGLACALFGAYPLSRLGGVRRNLEFTGELADRGFCPLIFPEGERSPDGRLMHFRSGVGLWATRLKLPVVPVLISGTFEAYSIHDRRPRRGEVWVDFHAPMNLSAEDSPEMAAQVLREIVGEMADARRASRSL